MSPLYAELHRWAGQAHDWGRCDCMTTVCDWIASRTGMDPMADLRLAYSSPAECQRLTGFLHDPLAAVSPRFEAAGLTLGNELRPGDVGILRRRDDPRWPVGGLWLGEAWGCKGPDGTTTLAPAMVEVLAFWSVGYEAAT